jgi:hypothetical protein
MTSCFLLGWEIGNILFSPKKSLDDMVLTNDAMFGGNED